jgi:hypothetical protein
MPTILFQDTFAGSSNLNGHTPTPSGGGSWEYIGSSTRYRCNSGYMDAEPSAFASIARNTYTVPPGLTYRIGGELFREGVDAVGGYWAWYAYVPSMAIASWDFKDCLRFIVQRVSLTQVGVSVSWVKAVTEPAPAEVQLAFVGSLLHYANTGWRYELEIDDVAGVFRVYRSDFGAGTNEVFLGSGTFPAQLLAHSTADREVAAATTRASFGLVNFRLYGFTVRDMAVVVSAPCTLLLTVYEDDRSTVLWEVGTSPAHAYPYLVEPDHYQEQEIDVAAGSATLGTVGVTVIDPATIPGDQDSGWLTDKLALLGLPNIAGHRCRLVRFISDALGYQVVADGPASAVRLDASYSAYSWDIRDTRETERKVRAFDDSTGITTPAITGTAPPQVIPPNLDLIIWGTTTN